MLDRQKIETILTRRFPGAAHHQVAAAANAIMGLDEEWEEVVDRDHGLGCHFSVDCRDTCWLARELNGGLDGGSEFRLFRRRQA